MKPNLDDILMTPKEVKGVLKCSLPWVYQAADKGKLPCVRIPCSGKGEIKTQNMIRFKRSDVFNFIEQYYKGPVEKGKFEN